MAKRNLNWTDDKLQRYIKEGRGSGEGKDYKPWLITQDFPTMGIATRVMGYKTHRMHHFFSNTQLYYFYLLEWDSNVIDIKEHFPLIDIEDTLVEQDNLKIDKFIDKESKTPYVITTTFLITIADNNGNNRYVARSIKYASELNKKTTQEKLEIERRYWEAKSIDWGIITNKEINSIRVKNIEWLHTEMLGDINLILDEDDAQGLLKGLFYRLAEENSSVIRIIGEFERDYELEKGKGLLLFKFLLAKKVITVNIDKQINLNEKPNSLILEFKEDWK